ncbi:MAG: hypothetical protein M1830_006007, partial [Pleopsidium flavum]
DYPKLAATSDIGKGSKLEDMGRDNVLLHTMTGTEYLAAEDKDLRKPTGIGSKQGDLTMAMVFSMTQEGNQNSLNVRTAASTCMAPQVAIKHQKILTQVIGNTHDIAKDRSSEFEAWQRLFDSFEGERITMTWAVCAIRRYICLLQLTMLAVEQTENRSCAISSA